MSSVTSWCFSDVTIFAVESSLVSETSSIASSSFSIWVETFTVWSSERLETFSSDFFSSFSLATLTVSDSFFPETVSVSVTELSVIDVKIASSIISLSVLFWAEMSVLKGLSDWSSALKTLEGEGLVDPIWDPVELTGLVNPFKDLFGLANPKEFSWLVSPVELLKLEDPFEDLLAADLVGLLRLRLEVVPNSSGCFDFECSISSLWLSPVNQHSSHPNLGWSSSSSSSSTWLETSKGSSLPLLMPDDSDSNVDWSAAFFSDWSSIDLLWTLL